MAQVAEDLAHRKPQTWLNYPGDVVANTIARANEPMGPDGFGQPVWVVTADYDEETDKTRVGLTFFPPVEQVDPRAIEQFDPYSVPGVER